MREGLPLSRDSFARVCPHRRGRRVGDQLLEVNGRSLLDVTHAQALAVFKAVRHDLHVTIRLRRLLLVPSDGQLHSRQLLPQTRLRLQPVVIVNHGGRGSDSTTSSMDVPRPDYDEGDDASEEGPTSYVPKHGLSGYGDARNLPRGPTSRLDRQYTGGHSNYYDYDTTTTTSSTSHPRAASTANAPPKKHLRFAGETRYFYA